MGVIKCCKGCVPPNRYLGCHSECEQYKAEKQQIELQQIERNKQRTNDSALNKLHANRSRKLHDAGLRSKYR